MSVLFKNTTKSALSWLKPKDFRQLGAWAPHSQLGRESDGFLRLTHHLVLLRVTPGHCLRAGEPPVPALSTGQVLRKRDFPSGPPSSQETFSFRGTRSLNHLAWVPEHFRLPPSLLFHRNRYTVFHPAHQVRGSVGHCHTGLETSPRRSASSLRSGPSALYMGPAPHSHRKGV